MLTGKKLKGAEEGPHKRRREDRRMMTEKRWVGRGRVESVCAECLKEG